MRYLTILAVLIVPSLRCQAADLKPLAVAVPDRKEPVSYAKEIVDILGAKCVACHNEALAENQLNMEEVPLMLKGGKSGPAMIAGKADQSLVFLMAAHRVEPVMPPKAKKDLAPLSPQELGLLKLWIDAGAKDDSEEVEATKVELGTLPPGLHAINAVDLTVDGQKLASGRANVVQVVDVDSGLEIISLGGHKDYIQSLRFSPDGRRLAAGSYQDVSLWKVPSGGLRSKFEGHADQVKAVVKLADGAQFATVSLDKTIKVWETNSGRLLQTYPVAQPPVSLAVSSDSKLLAVGCVDGSTRVVQVADGKESVVLNGHAGSVHAVAFLSDRRLVTGSADSTVRVWTLNQTGTQNTTEPTVLARHKGAVSAVVSIPNSEQIATAGQDGTIRLWQPVIGKLLKTFTLQGGAVTSLAIEPNGNRLVAGSADGIGRLIEVASGSLLAIFPGPNGPIEAVAFNAKGDRLATSLSAGGIKIWETDSGRGVIAFGQGPLLAPTTPPTAVTCLAFLKDDLVVSGGTDKSLKSWAFEGRWEEERWLGPHAYRVLSLDFNPDGTLLAAGGGEPSRSGEIKIWEVGKGMHVRTLDSLHSDTVYSLRFSPDGSKLASAGADKFVKVIYVDSGKEFRSYEGHTQHVMAVDWKADGKRLVSGGADSVLKAWDVESGEQVLTFAAAGKQVTSVRWIPGKSEVLGAAGDNVVRTWNSDDGQVKRVYGGSTDYLFAVTSSIDGKLVVGGGADGAIYFWNGDTGALIRKAEIPAANR